MSTSTTAYIAFGVVVEEPESDAYPGPLDNIRCNDVVSVELSGDDSELTRIVCIRESVYKSEWGQTVIPAAALVNPGNWESILLRRCAELGAKPKTVPCWSLFWLRL